MKAHRIIIPATLQKEILTKLHAPHQGTERTKLRARTSVYWRGLYKDIEETTKTCSTCEELQHSQQKEPLITTEVPPRAWHTIGADLFALNGSEYLVVADYYSKYPFVGNIPSGQSNSSIVLKIMRQLFSEQGIPEVVRTDNGRILTAKPSKSSFGTSVLSTLQAPPTTLVAMGLSKAKSSQ